MVILPFILNGEKRRKKCIKNFKKLSYKNYKINRKYKKKTNKNKNVKKKLNKKKNLKKKILRMKTKLLISGNTDQCLAMSLVILSIPLVC